MKVEVKYVALDHLIPYVRNARKHPERQLMQLAGSIKEYGFINPVIVDHDGSIVAGHGRVLAAQKLGMVEVPTISVEHLSPAQVKAFRLADNRIGEGSEWDFELLGLEIGELKDLGLDLVDLDFDLGKPIPDDTGDEIGEDAGKDVKMVTCPSCETEFPV